MNAQNLNRKINEDDNVLLLTRTFDAPRETVWKLWTDPVQVVKWWGPNGFTTTIAKMDVKTGGVWEFTMHGPDGVDYHNHNVFKEVVKPERIVYVHGGGSAGAPEAEFEATWTFDALAEDKTKVTIRMVFPTAKLRDLIVKKYGAEEGGKQTLERLSETLTTAPVIIERSFDAPIEKVWNALTQKDQMKQWYFDMPGFEPKVGCNVKFDVHHKGNVIPHQIQVTEVIPNRKISYNWEYPGHSGKSHVTFELTAQGSKTLLTLTHENVHSFKDRGYNCSNFVDGWTHITASLKKFVE